MQQKTIEVGSFQIAYYDNENDKPALVLLHGNSLSSQIFEKQFIDKKLNKKYRIIAFDLPGHGNSSQAKNPTEEYTADSFINVLVEFGEKLNLTEVVYLGHSLSGHLVIEASPEMDFLKGMIITGTPPLAIPPAMEAAFLPNPVVEYLFLPEMTKQQIALVAKSMLKHGSQVPLFISEDVTKADGNARAGIGVSVASGNMKDEIKILKETKLPIAILHGEKEDLISLEYLQNVEAPTLWKNSIQIITNAGHSPQYENAEAFNELLDDFMEEIF